MEHGCIPSKFAVNSEVLFTHRKIYLYVTLGQTRCSFTIENTHEFISYWFLFCKKKIILLLCSIHLQRMAKQKQRTQEKMGEIKYDDVDVDDDTK